jgi:RteC protein
MNAYCVAFYADFEVEYQALKQNFSDIILLANKIIPFLKRKIKELHKWLKNHIFENTAEEIYFFKEVKPKLTAKLIFYNTILKIESNLPSSKKMKKKCYEKALTKIYQYSKSNKDFYQYYRSKASFNDTIYFVRNIENYQTNDDCYLINYDDSVCTSHDYKVAILLSNDLLTAYLENKIEEIENSCRIKHPSVINQITWTGNKIDLVELIYALHHQKVFNGGNTDIKEIASYVSKIFNIEIEENIYRSYLDIKNRKSNRTKFLNQLAENFNQKLLSEEM